jgi:predicted HTH domain antitoxin
MSNTHKIISIEFPADILLALNANEAELKNNIKISLAIRFYQQQKLTIGKAAQLAGLSRLNFELLLAENQVPISNLDIDDINSDSKKLV